MKLRIRHCTEYQFSQPVYIEPHLVRKRPRPGPGYTVDQHRLTFAPSQVQSRELLAFDGARAALVTLPEMTDHLSIEAETLVSFSDYNPFDFLIYPLTAARVDGLREYARSPQFAPYVLRDQADPAVDAFALAAIDAAGGDTVTFFSTLAERLCSDITYRVRETGEAYSPAQLLATREGACRDFSVLYIDLCRAAGLPARFVSGYLTAVDDEDAVQYLHAWAEVYIPGAGWRGFDPTHGIAATSHYLPAAAARSPEDAAAVSGTFRGTGATATMATVLHIEEMD